MVGLRPVENVPLDIVRRFLGFPSFDEHLAELMRKFTVRLKSSSYELIRSMGEEAIASDEPGWSQYRRSLLSREESEESKLTRAKHPAFMTVSSDVELLLLFSLESFPRVRTGRPRCRFCSAQRGDCGDHLLTKCKEGRIVKIREGFEKKFGYTLKQLVDLHDSTIVSGMASIETMREDESPSVDGPVEVSLLSNFVADKLAEECSSLRSRGLELVSIDVCPGFTDIYTDGACPNNQSKQPVRAGCGVYFGDDDPRNIAEPLEPYGPNQFLSNNRAELQAIILALREPSLLDTPIRILTDSQYAIDGAQGVSAPTKNLDLWSQLLHLVRGRRIEWCKVKGHSNIRGNICADALANYGALSAQPIEYREDIQAREDYPWVVCISTLRRIYDLRNAITVRG